MGLTNLDYYQGYDTLRLIIYEADCPERCNYDKITEKIKEKGFRRAVCGFQNVWIKE